jgi:hypothetical protein
MVAGGSTMTTRSKKSFYDAGIQKLVSRYYKCLNNGGNHVEK